MHFHNDLTIMLAEVITFTSCLWSMQQNSYISCHSRFQRKELDRKESMLWHLMLFPSVFSISEDQNFAFRVVDIMREVGVLNQLMEQFLVDVTLQDGRMLLP